MTSLSYRQDIQGLRALAVLAVIAFHYDPKLLPGGFVGVDVFLVISGYLITGILLKRKLEGGRSVLGTLWQFYISRVWRIVPACYVMLLLVSLASAILFTEGDFVYYRNSLRAALRFTSNNFFAGFGDYFAPGLNEQPLLHTWSLAVEMQFYLLYPLVVLLLPSKWIKIALPVAMAAFLAAAEYALRINGDTQATYYSLSARVPEFLAGAAIALYGLDNSAFAYTKRFWLWGAGASMLLIAAFCFRSHDVFPGLASMLPVTGTVFLLLANSEGQWSPLRYSGLVWMGALSYSLYLWHWPILALLRYYEGGKTLSLAGTACFVVVTALLAIASYYWVEKPLQGKRLMTRSRNVRLGLVLLMLGAVFVLPGLVKRLNISSSPAELPIAYKRYAAPQTICHGAVIGNCLKGDLGSNREVLVLGDSHAAMLNNFFDVLGKERGFKARIITASSCVPLPGFDYSGLPAWAREPCQRQMAVAEQYLQEADTIFLAAYWSEQLQHAGFRQVLEAFVSGRPGQEIFLLPQEPLLGRNPLRVWRMRELGLGGRVMPTDEHQKANLVLQQLVSGRESAIFLPFSEVSFFDDAPYYQGHLIYFDEHHLNEHGASAYASFLLSQASNLLATPFPVAEAKHR